jgi:ribonuclease J
VDIVVPNFEYLEENKHRVAGILSHGHADAIRSPYLLEKVKVPVFGSHLTIELVKLLLKIIMQRKNSMIFM